MHVLQYIAVEAGDKKIAYKAVEENLLSNPGPEGPFSSWFDWFVVGGGRWNNESGKITEDYAEGKTNMFISYDEDPEAFRNQIDKSMESRKVEFDSYAKCVDSSFIHKIITEYNPRDFDFSLFQHFYPIKKIIDMVYGEWDFSSCFYDIVHDSTSPIHLLNSIDKGNKNWFLVPVDFHVFGEVQTLA
jgi:hypothetical protein